MISLLPEFEKLHVVVLGDVMLDRYLWGDVERISPEAPVPVIKISSESDVLGGAANVAANLAALSCKVTLIGTVGDDSHGRKIQALLNEKKITAKLIQKQEFTTITKSRIMASTQQLLRIDHEITDHVQSEGPETMDPDLKKDIRQADAVILSDYHKGFLKSAGYCESIITFCRKNDIRVFVDSKDTSWEKFSGASVVTPNDKELSAIGDTYTANKSKPEDRAQVLCRKFNFDHILITRGAAGMSLVSDHGMHMIVPSEAKEVFDVSGAGDTVLAAYTAALTAGAKPETAARFSNTAAGIAVGKLGTQPVSSLEIEQELELIHYKNETRETGFKSWKSARLMIQLWQKNNKTVVFTSGCYDILHPGHISLLERSKELGDYLVVGLNSDSSVHRLKGKERPIVKEKDRASIISALSCVDLVVLFDEDTPAEVLTNLKPDIHVKGADYNMDQIKEKDAVLSYGGRIELLPLVKGYSTTGIAEKMKGN